MSISSLHACITAIVWLRGSSGLVVMLALESLYQDRKTYCLPNSPTQNQGQAPIEITNNKFRNLAWIFVKGRVGIWRGYWGTGKKGLKYFCTKVASFLGPKFVLLSENSFDGSLSPKGKIRAHPLTGQIPSVLASSGVVASEALSHDRNPGSPQDLPRVDLERLHLASLCSLVLSVPTGQNKTSLLRLGVGVG